MDSNQNLYTQIYSLKNLFLAYRKARKGKSKKDYVLEFEKNLRNNLLELQKELKTQTYKPKPLETFILRDPKTRKISKSAFRDRVIHHALVRVIEPIFEKSFIYDSCANRVGKGTLFALKRFEKLKRKVTNNLNSEAFCLKADIKHYFQEVNHEILITLIKRKIKDSKVIWLIYQILQNSSSEKGMPLGNLTSQFFANVYLNELDYFVKHKLKVKFYIRYVDDFVILHKSKTQLGIWKAEIAIFTKNNLNLELHSDKSKVVSLSRGADFVGFRIFYYHKLLRKRSINKMFSLVKKCKEDQINYQKFSEIFQGWQAYASWANSHNLISMIFKQINPNNS